MNRGRLYFAAGVLSLVITVWFADAVSSAPLTTTRLSSATTQSVEIGPDVVLLKQLTDLYEPVPFNHRGHAQMAQMWDGCTTCHHRNPETTTRPATLPVDDVDASARTQDQAAAIPACKSCHEIKADEAGIQMPSLKGAYHRQCLNCHREWMHENACVICHKPREKNIAATESQPTPDDIVGRMHSPIPEPDTQLYKMRFTPADGPNVLFRHKEHSADFGIKCVSCHRRDNCAHCHAPGAAAASKPSQKPVHLASTWRETHGPCLSCHQQDRCRHCHFQDDQPAPAAFVHATTGQELDKDHVKLPCRECHAELKVRQPPTCGGTECHKPGKLIAFPAQRPGKVVATQPAPPTTQMNALKPGTARRVQQ